MNTKVFEKWTRKFSFLTGIFLLCTSSKIGFSSEWAVRIGPAAPGNGGPNPLAIPPTQIAQYEFGYITDSLSEWTVGIVPGIFYGKRNKKGPGPYFSYGGGLVIGANGVAPGVYTAFGGNFFCESICFIAEYKQGLGISGSNIIGPYAVRIGLGGSF